MGKEILGSLELNRVYQMDCLEGMKLIPDDSIDLTVTSPPYDDLRKYNGYSFDFENIAKELYRITKVGGIVVWIVGDATIKGSESGTSFRQALYFKDECGFNIHDTMIYEKATPAPQAQHPRFQPCFEYMFILCKGYPPNTFNKLMVPTKSNGQIRKTNGQRNKDNSYRHTDKKSMIVNPTKLRKNIWAYPNERRKDFLKRHPAPFPEELAKDHILAWSNEGDIVFDPFMGSGTTAKMAKINNRRYLGFEISSQYIQIINKRLESVTEDYIIEQ